MKQSKVDHSGLRVALNTVVLGRWIPSVSVLLLGMVVTMHVAAAQAPDRGAPPKLGPPPALKLAPIQHFTLTSGLRVIMVEKHEVPLVQINLLIKAGSAMDPEGKSGLTSMAAAMLTEGAGRRNALQLADAIDYLGAHISASAGQHTTAIDLHTPLAKLDSALALLADVVMRPTFPLAELERKRKERLTMLLQWRDEPGALASVTFNRILYSDKHPYGRTSIGNEKSLRSLQPVDLQKFHSMFFGHNNAVVIVVGDVTPPFLLPKLESAFAGWKAVAVGEQKLQGIMQVEQRSVTLVDKPGAAQSEIRIGRIGAPRLTDDYDAIIVMNTILGGSFTSRLNQNLRETHGYSYGAGSRFDFRPLPGPFQASAAVQTAVTDKALIEFFKEMNGILQPVSYAELERAKNYIALGFPGEFQSVARIASRLEELAIYNLPDDYFNNYVSRILAVTKDDVQRVARKYIDPEKVAIVIVGDRKVIESGLQALNLGRLKLLTVQDILGKPPMIEVEK